MTVHYDEFEDLGRQREAAILRAQQARNELIMRGQYGPNAEYESPHDEMVRLQREQIASLYSEGYIEEARRIEAALNQYIADVEAYEAGVIQEMNTRRRARR
jgi:hypothetical protein